MRRKQLVGQTSTAGAIYSVARLLTLRMDACIMPDCGPPWASCDLMTLGSVGTTDSSGEEAVKETGGAG